MKKPIIILACALLAFAAGAQPPQGQPPVRQAPMGRGMGAPMNYASEQAAMVADQMLLYQRVTGGWPKNINMYNPLTEQQKAQVLRDKQRTDDSTVDNNATTSQMTYLANVFQATSEPRFREGFLKGLEYLLSGQYENGGWPQFWPDPTGYQVQITFNDNNIINMLSMFRDILDGKAPYGGALVGDDVKARIQNAYDKGLDCLLNCQIVVKKQPTVWCQQHDPVTLKPTGARAFELPSYCSAESAHIVDFLMGLPNPDKRIKAAIHGAMKWFDTYKITGYKFERSFMGGDRATRLVEDPSAQPMWARFYDLKYCEPYVCDRDGLPRRYLSQIGRERRNGYGWYNSNAASLYPKYAEWLKVNDPRYKSKVDLASKGGNETGVYQLFRKHVMNPKDFDVVVRPGESVQAAIDKAPAEANGYFKILVLAGTYHQTFNVNKPSILLVGEDKDKVIFEITDDDAKAMAEAAGGRRANTTIVNISEEGTDLVMSGFTLTNKMDASPTNPAQPQSIQHRMVVMGRADRTIIVNCNINSTGNDALSLWAPGGDGMYYHADLDIRTPGVDFICPRGWCFATRCHFYGDGRAMIWHDGRGDQSKKFVIKDSDFDAASPTLLGRYHHDASFFILNCRMSANILDQNIHYAYSDQVKDPCVWGERYIYYNNVREGGHSGWLTNNLSKIPTTEAHPQPWEQWEFTALWTFNDKWDPEKVLRDLWDIMEY